jgi:teichuronic acid biosynthesis glycosyltransferase TuaC
VTRLESNVHSNPAGIPFDQTARRLRVVSLSTVFPNPLEPGLGLFVQSRLRSLAKLGDLRVVAPVPVVDYSNPNKKWLHIRRGYPMRFRDQMDVLYPRWVYPPGGTPMNVACLFARLLPLFQRLWHERPFDVIDAHFGYPEGVAAALLARRFRVPFAVTLRGSEIPFAAYRSRQRLMKWALPQASVVFTVSEELRQFAVKHGAAADRVRLIPNGVDSDTFHPRSQAHCRSRFEIPQHRKIIVTAGELIAAKGHHRVIQALPALLEAGIDAQVVIAGGVSRGGASFEPEIRHLIDTLRLSDRVRMLGWVPRTALAEVMCAGDVFCLASDIEGWPNVVHEALSCGTPVVATRVGAVPEMVPGEDLGIVIPVQDQPALVGALRQALSAKWDSDAIARWGRSRGWDQVAEEVYEELRIATKSRTGCSAIAGICTPPY